MTDTVDKSPSIDDKPEMKQLLSLDRGSGRKPLRIVERVTANCDNLGLMLDLSADIVDILWRVSQEGPEKKCKNILSK